MRISFVNCCFWLCCVLYIVQVKCLDPKMSIKEVMGMTYMRVGFALRGTETKEEADKIANLYAYMYFKGYVMGIWLIIAIMFFILYGLVLLFYGQDWRFLLACFLSSNILGYMFSENVYYN